MAAAIGSYGAGDGNRWSRGAILQREIVGTDDPTAMDGLVPRAHGCAGAAVASTRSILSFAAAASGCVSSGSLPSHQSSSRSSITSGGVSTR